MFVVLLPNVFHTNDMFALSENSAEKKTKTGRLPIAHYKQKPAGSDLWPVNRCIPTNFGQRQRIGNVALALFAILNTAHPLYASYFEVKYLLFLRQSGKHAVLAKLSATVRNIHRCTSSSVL